MCYCFGNAWIVLHEVIIIPDYLDFLPLDEAAACLLQDILVFSNNCKEIFLSVNFIFLITSVSEELVAC